MRISLIVAGTMFLAACQNRSESDDWEVEEVPLGYQGAARINPYLAAERYLSENGYDAKSSLVWSEKEEEMDIILMPASFLSTTGMGMRALEWVQEGGMLVITVEGGEGEINDFRKGESFFFGNSDPDLPGFDYLIEEAGIEVATEEWKRVEETEREGHLRMPWHVAEFSVSSGDESFDYEVEFEGDVALNVEYGVQWDSAQEDKGRMVTTEYGNGDIMVLAHARAFRNAYIDRADHAEFVKLIADWRGSRSIVFLYGSGTSFTGLLWRHAWQAIVAGLILLAFWLWMRIPRFGPLKEDDHHVIGGYGNQLTASARFLWRKKQLHCLLRPLRERIEAEHRDDPDSFYRNLAEQFGLSREDVVEAMTASESKDPASQTKIVRTLQTILKL